MPQPTVLSWVEEKQCSIPLLPKEPLLNGCYIIVPSPADAEPACSCVQSVGFCVLVWDRREKSWQCTRWYAPTASPHRTHSSESGGTAAHTESTTSSGFGTRKQEDPLGGPKESRGKLIASLN